MICNVCGEDRRCFTLTESTQPMMFRAGMLFAICTGCLGKLIDTIKTDKTVVDDPELFPLPAGAIRRMDAMNAKRIEIRNNKKLDKPIG
jgi:hypothetical protein